MRSHMNWTVLLSIIAAIVHEPPGESQKKLEKKIKNSTKNDTDIYKKKKGGRKIEP